MNRKLIIATVSVLAIGIVSGSVLFAQPRLSKDKKDFYDNKRIEHNKENDAIGQEKLKVAKMSEGVEREQKLKELEQREIKYKNESTETANKMDQDGYVSDEDTIDSNAKLIKKLEGLRALTEWDIKNESYDKELADYSTQQLNQIKTLLDKVKQANESNFSNLYSEYNKMIKGFQEDRPKFEKQYKEKHGR